MLRKLRVWRATYTLLLSSLILLVSNRGNTTLVQDVLPDDAEEQRWCALHGEVGDDVIVVGHTCKKPKPSSPGPHRYSPHSPPNLLLHVVAQVPHDVFSIAASPFMSFSITAISYCTAVGHLHMLCHSPHCCCPCATVKHCEPKQDGALQISFYWHCVHAICLCECARTHARFCVHVFLPFLYDVGSGRAFCSEIGSFCLKNKSGIFVNWIIYDNETKERTFLFLLVLM